jgi:CubicO group peptidase (beta-lactamase class C family)
VRRQRTRAAWAAAVLAVGAVAALGAYTSRIVSILVAYKAKQLCSGVFVAGRAPDAVERDLEVDDLAVLRYVDAAIEARTRSATASFAGIAHEAADRGPTGCALVFAGDDESAPARLNADAAGSAPRAAPPETWPDDAVGASEPARDRRLAAIVERAFRDPDPSRPQRTRAIVVLHGGRIVAERYSEGISADTPLLGWSMTKSVMNALAGILVRDGTWSLATPLPIAEWQSGNDGRRAITLDHALRMSTGLAFDEELTIKVPDVLTMLVSRDMAAFAADKPLEAEPGTRWQYSSGTSVVLARAMRHLFASQAAYEAFPQEALFRPLGMTRALIETDAAGTYVGSSLMFATARDWTRFGQLYLRDGVWDGVRILPDGWVEYTRTPAPADPSRRYGAHFWLDVPDGYGASRASLPADAFHAAGHQGQFVTIVPSRDAVIVRLGATRYREAWDHAAFVRDVLEGLLR